MTNQTVCMTANVPRLIKAQRDTFTHSYAFIAELMQNARRAGATKVDFNFDETTNILSIEDDGHGIQSWDKLLCLAESDWSNPDIDEESPFGIGFLSALFSAQVITIRSRDGVISADTDDLLSGEAIDIETEDFFDGCLVQLCDLHRKPTANQINHQVALLASGFPLPVSLNGMQLERPCALPNLDAIPTEIGMIRLPENPEQFSFRALIYLQGLPISRMGRLCHQPSSFRDMPAEREIQNQSIIHLDPSAFRARLPDRDCLVDEKLAVNAIREAMKTAFRSHAEQMKASRPERLTYCLDQLRDVGCHDLLNDVPYIPPGLVSPLSDEDRQLPSNIEEFDRRFCASENQKPIPMADVVDGKLRLVAQSDLSDRDEDKPHPWVAQLVKLGYSRLEDGLHEDHWVNQHLLDTGAIRVDAIVPVNPKPVSRFTVDYANFDLVYCDAVRVESSLGVTVINDALVAGEAEPYYVTARAHSHDLGAVLSYFDYDDDKVDNDHRSDCEERFSAWMKAQAASDPAELLHGLLETLNLSGFSDLRGRSFKLSVGGDYKLTVEAA
ncbi:ATP-binding protein [Salinisphaera sp. P385]|uniref:ATP-binding protein n=1 Tax=Spectribacter acetivorans TaxID=3075603 RepID=A0ABU3BB70_9GAMM|nr:ATP-binding protein [Salinisphaera sp. P385]MDT0618508.1 ATP-binding protein [Salinisphaera sp. P385]